MYRKLVSPTEGTTACALRPPPLGTPGPRGDIGPWPIAHSAMRPHRGVAPGVPVCPSREHVAPRPLRRIALWSVLRGKTIPPLHPSPASGHAVCLLVSGKPTVKTHTHECGSISSGWPPNQPASRIAKLFGEGGVHGQVSPVRAVALAAAVRLENFCARQAGGCAVPDPGRFGSQTYGHATTLPWWFPEHLETPT